MRYYKKIAVKRPWNRWKELKKLWIKRQRTIARFSEAEFKQMPRLIDFDSDKYDVPKDLALLFKNPIACEQEYYGFTWIHELEKSPDYRGNLTFDVLKNDLDGYAFPVEIIVKRVDEKVSKKGSNYTQVIVEDVVGQENKINIWPDDWSRWSKEFLKGNLLRVRLQPPSGGFNTFLLESNQNGKFRGHKKYIDKDDDPRVFIMRFGKNEEEKFMTDEEVLGLFNNLNVENKND
jgi:DNA polymerase III alpha subunit